MVGTGLRTMPGATALPIAPKPNQEPQTSSGGYAEWATHDAGRKPTAALRRGTIELQASDQRKVRRTLKVLIGYEIVIRD